MKSGRILNLQSVARDITAFFIPKVLAVSYGDDKFSQKKITTIIPTYKPKTTTYRLAKQLVSFYPNVQVIIVDDGTPGDAKASMTIFKNLQALSQIHQNRVIVLRTPQNMMKASALNYGLEYISTREVLPDIIVTADDDVVITKDTLPKLIDSLYADKKTGVACSRAFVKNKHANLLTRLQSLEYHGFNITKTSDNGFLMGPLVMHGMLSAFKYPAIRQVNGFDTDNLIEDYDITVRIKRSGWNVVFVPDAQAWTTVPESLSELWRQRIRWSYGGLIVVWDFWKEFKAIFHDFIGHFLYLSLLSLIMLSFIVSHTSQTNPLLVALLLFTGIIYFFVAFLFNTMTLLTYKERDKIDWLIKLTIIPEFIYSNMLSAIMIGSYLYFLFNILSFFAMKQFPMLTVLYKAGTKTFQKFGYSKSWGTRVS